MHGFTEEYQPSVEIQPKSEPNQKSYHLLTAEDKSKDAEDLLMAAMEGGKLINGRPVYLTTLPNAEEMEGNCQQVSPS